MSRLPWFVLDEVKPGKPSPERLLLYRGFLRELIGRTDARYTRRMPRTTNKPGSVATAVFDYLAVHGECRVTKMARECGASVDAVRVVLGRLQMRGYVVLLEAVNRCGTGGSLWAITETGKWANAEQQSQCYAESLAPLLKDETT